MFVSPSRMSGSLRLALRMSGSGREALLDVQEWSECPPGYPGVVGIPCQMFLSGGKPFWMSGSCREAPRMSGNGRETLLDVWEPMPDVR